MTELEEAQKIYNDSNGPKDVPVFDDKFKAQALNQLTELENESEIKSKIQTEMDY